MERFLFEHKTILPCREEQLTQIFRLIGEKDEPLPHCLFLHGSAATGKKSCMKSILDYLGYKHVVLNSVECYSQRNIYETILNALHDHTPNHTGGYSSVCQCDNMMSFVNHLNCVKYASEPVVLVFNNANRLRDLDHNVLPALMRLKEFCRLNVCTVLISSVPFEKYHVKTGMKEPIRIHFPEYGKDELYKIMSTNYLQYFNYVFRRIDRNEDGIIRQDLFANYLNAFLSVFFRPCRDLVELKHLARLNFVKYCEPILNGTIEADDVTKLWRNIAPILKANLETLYLRVNMDRADEAIHTKLERLDISSNRPEKALTEELTSVRTFARSFELPFYAKYLLIAAYLASFNPAKEDKRLFMKNHGKQRKRLQQVNANAKLSEKLNMQLGPKIFTLDRLLAIFYAILEEKASLTANLLVQISSLVNLRLLTASSDMMRFKCTVSYEFIAAISKMVGFNIRKYLYDFI